MLLGHRTTQRLALVFDQSVGQITNITSDDLIQLIYRQTNAMIGDSIVGVVVGANALAAVTRSDQRLTLIGSVLVNLALLKVVDSRFQNPQRFGEILVLAFFILNGDDDPSLMMRQSNGRISLVNLLATGTAGAIIVSPIVIGLDVDLDILRFRQHRNGGS